MKQGLDELRVWFGFPSVVGVYSKGVVQDLPFGTVLTAGCVASRYKYGTLAIFQLQMSITFVNGLGMN